MEYIEGESLEELIRKNKRFLEKECLEIVKGVLRGLNYAHMKGIVHRDIKPSNIMITNEGAPKIMDFGIALVSGEKKITKTGFAIGASYYMSPEQIKGRELDHRSDVYSMGIVLYEMLTGYPPFDGDTDYEIQHKHIHEVPRPLKEVVPEISEELSHILTKALEKNPDDRFDGCGDFLGYRGV